jgi:hypothetical protein
MSMIGNVLRLSPEQAAQLQADPDLIEAVLEACSGFGDSDDAAELGDLAPQLDLQKNWHVLHYLLTGEAWGGSAPQNFLLSGTEIGDDVTGYGPARLHSAAMTQSVSKYFETLDFAALLAGLDFGKMKAKDIYAVDEASDAEKAVWVTELTENLQELREYLSLAAAKGELLLIWLD